MEQKCECRSVVGKLLALKSAGSPKVKWVSLPTCACLHSVNCPFILSFSIRRVLHRKLSEPKEIKLTSVQIKRQNRQSISVV